MRKGLILFFCALLSISFFSCKETAEISEYNDNWDGKNVQYLDSIAKVARANKGDKVGEWKVIKSFRLPSSSMNSIITDESNDQFVYAKILRVGDGEISPVYTDSVTVSYEGRLIPTASHPEGYVFDKNFYGSMTEENLPTMSVSGWTIDSGLITAWPTALMRMHAGDIWRIYCPYTLGYGKTGDSSIPGYSTLVFDIYLKEVFLKR